ncbi:hypothetical protein M9H77_23877 [Catharanthus roseus]|uniref:Uncharacterized protein n=1 Tax=Catharanthus roseus TaxID=4058 RepID=A0ACC0AUI1_CATRO|nr:hypothetical protein M9H77_23877 [Catharanthus roseus]
MWIKQLSMPPQRVAKVGTLKPSMIEEFSKVNELPQAQEVVEESIVIQDVEETSNEDSCDNMNEKSIEKHESEKEEQRGEEIVLLENSEEVNFYANETNSFLTSESLWVQNFEDSSKDEYGKIAYRSIKTINFFPSNSYFFFEIYFNEIKLFSFIFMENVYQFYFLNSLGTLLEKKHFIEFNSLSCFIRRIHEYYGNSANYVSYVLGIKDKGMNMEKEHGNFLKIYP